MSQKARDIRRVFGCGRNEESSPQALIRDPLPE